MTRAFVDTNVVVYAIHDVDTLKQETARRLMRSHLTSRTMVLSTQVLQETYSVLTVKKKLPSDAALSVLTSLAEEEVVSSNAAMVLRAAGLAHRFQLSIWDALMVQAALDAQCELLYTEDLQAGMRFGTLEIVNPFKLSAHEPTPAPPIKAPALPRRRAASAAPAAPARAARRPRK
jgi:predicted nucleic acid-binding protein